MSFRKFVRVVTLLFAYFFQSRSQLGIRIFPFAPYNTFSHLSCLYRIDCNNKLSNFCCLATVGTTGSHASGDRVRPAFAGSGPGRRNPSALRQW